MADIYQDIILEIQQLRRLKQSIFEEDSQKSDLTASNICLSADVLLIPLYWYITSTQPYKLPPIEGYMREQVSIFDTKVSTIIPRLLERTKELDNRYSSQPFKRYRVLLTKCFPQYITV